MSKLCVRELYVRKLRVSERVVCEYRRAKATEGDRRETNGSAQQKTRTPHKDAGKNAKNSTNHYLKT